MDMRMTIQCFECQQHALPCFRRAKRDCLRCAQDHSGEIDRDEFAPLIQCMEPEITDEEIRLTFMAAGGAQSFALRVGELPT